MAACPLKLELSRQWSLFAVLDGHGGKFAAEFVADKIVPILAEVSPLISTYSAAYTTKRS